MPTENLIPSDLQEFIRDHLEADAAAAVPRAAMKKVYADYCQARGFEFHEDYGVYLMHFFPDLKYGWAKVNGELCRAFYGVKLKSRTFP